MRPSEPSPDRPGIRSCQRHVTGLTNGVLGGFREGSSVGRLAQRLAQLLYTQWVGGSNPSPSTIFRTTLLRCRSRPNFRHPIPPSNPRFSTDYTRWKPPSPPVAHRHRIRRFDLRWPASTNSPLPCRRQRRRTCGTISKNAAIKRREFFWKVVIRKPPPYPQKWVRNDRFLILKTPSGSWASVGVSATATSAIGDRNSRSRTTKRPPISLRRWAPNIVPRRSTH